MNEKIEIGDTVQCTTCNGYFNEGERLEVEAVSSNGVWCYTADKSDHWHLADKQFKLISKKQMNKEEAIQKLENLESAFDTHKDVLKDVEKELVEIRSVLEKDNTVFEIGKWYKSLHTTSYNNKSNRLSIGGRIVFWDGVWATIIEEETKEMTVADVEALVGCKVKIIK